MPAAKAYSGRLAFDPDSGFHLAEDGKPVVTEDEGKTWRYATDEDTGHNNRYQRRVQVVDTTANQLAELSFKHGEERARELVEPHHWEAQTDDPHYDANVDGKATAQVDPDHLAPTITSHTEAYA